MSDVWINGGVATRLKIENRLEYFKEVEDILRVEKMDLVWKAKI